MRVLHVIDSLGAGGAERSLADLLPALTRAGVDNHVVCFRRSDTGFHEHVLSGGVSVSVVGTSRPAALRGTREVIRAWRPDLVHTCLYEADVLGRIAAAGQQARVLSSWVSTTYDSVARYDATIRPWKLTAARRVDSATARHLCDHFHAVSAVVADSYARHLRVSLDRVSIVHRGRDVGRLGMRTPERRARVRAQLNVPGDAKVVLNVGRQEWAKGQLHLLEAIASLDAARSNATLLIAGREGKATPLLTGRVASADLAGRVRFLGHRDDIGDLLCAADLFAVPSLYEGAAGSMLEAMAMGVPVVGSDIAAIRDATEDGAGARLVPPGDVPALAHAIEHVLDHRDEAARMVERAERIFFDRFTLERSAARMVELYQTVLEGGVR